MRLMRYIANIWQNTRRSIRDDWLFDYIILKTMVEYKRHMTDWRAYMPKPQRCRRICSKPRYTEFQSIHSEPSETIVLTLDEYEVIRLVDNEEKTHQECATLMNISRTTVTEIYKSARAKIADFLVNGKALNIKGGTYYYCGGEAYPSCRSCKKKLLDDKDVIRKGSNIMRIAVTIENEMIFQHFGHTEQFKFYDIEDNQVKSEKIVSTQGSGHGALAGFLQSNQVDILICGGIGMGAKNALSQIGVQVFGGVQGKADEAVAMFLKDNLVYDPNVQCSHHENHGEGHTCGDHGCKSHSCH